MSEPFLGEIRIFGGSYAPIGWALCAGQLLSIGENSALYSLLGTTYGGDGQATFALPDLQGRSPLHEGTAPGSSSYTLGQTGGSEAVELTPAQIPAHSHSAVYAATATKTTPGGAMWATQASTSFSETAPNAQLSPLALVPSGNSIPHENMPPFVAVTYMIALQGIYPTQG